MAFKRVLIKLSGEMLMGEREHGIDPHFINKLAQEFKQIVDRTGVEIAIMVGGGNFIRGAAVAGNGIDRVTADYMGMLATVLNGMALVDILEKNNQPARLLTRLHVASVAEPYIRRRGIRHLEKGRVVVIAGGSGNPFITTDTPAVTTALELNCDVVMKATKVDGVYNKDPIKHANAKRIEKLTYQEVLKNPDIAVMDQSAISLAEENGLPIVVFDLLGKNNMQQLIEGESIGSIISEG